MFKSLPRLDLRRFVYPHTFSTNGTPLSLILDKISGYCHQIWFHCIVTFNMMYFCLNKARNDNLANFNKIKNIFRRM